MVIAILPMLAVFILAMGSFFVLGKQNGIGLAKIASITAFALSILVVVERQFSSGEQHFEIVNSLQIGSRFQLDILQDRLSLFWLFLNSAVVTQIIWFDQQFKRASSRLSAILILTLFAVIQCIVLTNNAQLQWILISLSHWLLYANFVQSRSPAAPEVRPTQTVIFLTVADLFWMLGLLGIYLVTGSLDISLLSSDGLFVNLSDSASSLLITSVMSLLISLIIRCGFFPAMIWTNDFTTARTTHAMLWAFPISIGGYLLFRWLPILTLYPEPLTLLIGICALSAVLLAVSALFQTGVQQLQRLGSVLIAFAVLGVAAEPALSPQMAALFAGTILFLVTLSYQHSEDNSQVKSALQWGLLLLLLCGTYGVEVTLQVMESNGGANVVEIPPVMSPLLVITMGLFLYGVFQQIHLREENPEVEADNNLGNVFWGLSLLVLFQGVPFFLSTEIQYVFLFPITMTILIIVSISITMSIQSMGGLNSFELGSLVKLCRQDYYVHTIVERGLAIPIQIGALFVHFVDQYFLQGLLIKAPNWFTNEISETTQEIEDNSSAFSQCRTILLATLVLIFAVWLGLSSY